MRIVTLEEHFVTADSLKATAAYLPSSPHMQAIQAKLLDLGPGRIAAMDEAKIAVQVLSLAAIGFDQLDTATATLLARDSNDELAAAVRAQPTRYAGFATLGMRDPETAAKEFERAVTTLGFKGAMINGTTDGAFLDDPRFNPIFEVATALDVPIYLHPAPPPEPIMAAYFSGLPEPAGDMLARAGWGWHVETGLHCLRMMLGGVFDRYPKLQIVIGHMGENLPFSLARADGVLAAAAGTKHLQRSIAEYFHAHFHVTTSGYFTNPPFLCALEVVGADRLMFSVDYPFSATTTGSRFLESIAASPADLEKIAHGNADRLLRL
jgi:predicted TIM-barrel fold metal-dependent hydrolase